jgi:membrane protein
MPDAPQTGRQEPHEPRGTDTGTTTWALIKRTVTEFQEDGLTDWAAALTYYGLLSLFPALLALASIVGLVASPQTLTDALLKFAPQSAADTLSGPIQSITSNDSTAGVVLIVGLATALWGASGYIGAFGRASNAIYETREGRPFYLLRPLQLLITLVMVVLLAFVTLSIALTGPVLDAVADPIGLGGTARTAWDVAKWPVLAIVVLVVVAILFSATPNVRTGGIRRVLPGVALALVVWLVASGAFALYVAMFASYDKTYGTLGGVVVLLVWLWLTNVALLLGAELNAERERGRQLADGVPGAEREIQSAQRRTPAAPRTR